MKKQKKTAAEVLENLKSKGVVFENTRAPFSKESKNVSIMGNYNQRIVIGNKKSVWEKMIKKLFKK